ncbi:FlgD immunoglobulin-like domain containing protein [Pseudoneobacillus sp. C159]
MRKWGFLLWLLLLVMLFPMNGGAVEAASGDANELISGGIKASSKTFTMSGTNRHAFSFEAKGETHVLISIRNQNKEDVKLIFDKPWGGGKITAFWDGRVEDGSYASAGNYQLLAKVTREKGSATRTFDFKVVDKIAPTIKILNSSLYFSPAIGNTTLTIPFELNIEAKVTAVIYDQAGKKMATLAYRKPFQPGQQTLSWTGSTLKKDGTYQLAVTSVAVGNKVSGKKLTTKVIIDSQKPKASLLLPGTIFRMDGLGNYKAQLLLSEKVTANVRIVNSKGETVRELAKQTAYFAGTVNLLWDGLDVDNAVSPEGEYRYSLEMSDLAGNTMTMEGKPFTLQHWQTPKVTSLENVDILQGTQITVPFTIDKGGKVTVEVLKGQQVIAEILQNKEVALGEHSFAWNGYGIWPGTYQYRITLSDSYGLQGIFVGNISLISTEIKIDAPETVQFLDSGNKRAEVFFEISEKATVSIDIVDKNGYRQKSVWRNQVIEKGVHSFSWNGRNDSGNVVTEDDYVYIIRAKNEQGVELKKEGKVSKKQYPSWLYSQSIHFARDSEGRVLLVGLTAETAREIKLKLLVHLSLTDMRVLDQREFILSKGPNIVTYAKPETTPFAYSFIYEDHLGNRYTYIKDEK